MGLLEGKGLSKDDANYRQHEKCLTCMHYYPNSCDKVDGNISPDAVCNSWEMKVKTGPKDKEFFKKEFDKVKNSPGSVASVPGGA